MLYVFHVENGHMMSFDMHCTVSSVEKLKESIEKMYHIPAKSIVLLVKGGEMLSNPTQVSSYSAGTDTNPIYMFLKGDARSPPTVSTLQTDTELLQELDDSIYLTPSLETVRRRTLIAELLFEMARDDGRQCEQNVNEQYFQHQGWSAVIENFIDVVKEFKIRINNFQLSFDQHLSKRQNHIELINNFSDDLNKLSRIPILPDLMSLAETNFDCFGSQIQEDSETNANDIAFADSSSSSVVDNQDTTTSTPVGDNIVLASSITTTTATLEESANEVPAGSTTEATDNTATIPEITTPATATATTSTKDEPERASQSLSLLQWITSKEKHNTLHTMADECIQGLTVFNANVYEKSKLEVEGLIISADKSDIREIKGISERFIRLKKMIDDIKQLLQEQKELSIGFKKNQERAKHLGDNSILPDLCSSHQMHLQVMLEKHQRIREFGHCILKAKYELSQNIHVRLNHIILLENSMYKLDNTFMYHHHCVSRAETHLNIIEQIHRAPQLYVAAVTETVRRKIFSDEFCSWASKLAEDFEAIYLEEVSRRQDFNINFEGHFLNNIFPGLDDIPPSFATEMAIAFDTRLPNLTISDIEIIKEKIPDIAADAQLPDLRSMKRFFVARSDQQERIEEFVKQEVAATLNAHDEWEVVRMEGEYDSKALTIKCATMEAHMVELKEQLKIAQEEKEIAIAEKQEIESLCHRFKLNIEIDEAEAETPALECHLTTCDIVSMTSNVDSSNVHPPIHEIRDLDPEIVASAAAEAIEIKTQAEVEAAALISNYTENNTEFKEPEDASTMYTCGPDVIVETSYYVDNKKKQSEVEASSKYADINTEFMEPEAAPNQSHSPSSGNGLMGAIPYSIIQRPFAVQPEEATTNTTRTEAEVAAPILSAVASAAALAAASTAVAMHNMELQYTEFMVPEAAPNQSYSPSSDNGLMAPMPYNIIQRPFAVQPEEATTNTATTEAEVAAPTLSAVASAAAMHNMELQYTEFMEPEAAPNQSYSPSSDNGLMAPMPYNIIQRPFAVQPEEATTNTATTEAEAEVSAPTLSAVASAAALAAAAAMNNLELEYQQLTIQNEYEAHALNMITEQPTTTNSLLNVDLLLANVELEHQQQLRKERQQHEDELKTRLQMEERRQQQMIMEHEELEEMKEKWKMEREQQEKMHYDDCYYNNLPKGHYTRRLYYNPTEPTYQLSDDNSLTAMNTPALAKLLYNKEKESTETALELTSETISETVSGRASETALETASETAPETVVLGRPSDTGSETSSGRPFDIGSETTSGRPSDTGSETSSGRPSDTGSETTSGRPSDTGSETTSGRPSDTGSETTSGRPSDTGSETTSGRPSDTGSETTSGRPSDTGSERAFETASENESETESETETTSETISEKETTATKEKPSTSLTASYWNYVGPPINAFLRSLSSSFFSVENNVPKATEKYTKVGQAEKPKPKSRDEYYESKGMMTEYIPEPIFTTLRESPPLDCLFTTSDDQDILLAEGDQTAPHPSSSLPTQTTSTEVAAENAEPNETTLFDKPNEVLNDYCSFD